MEIALFLIGYATWIAVFHGAMPWCVCRIAIRLWPRITRYQVSSTAVLAPLVGSLLLIILAYFELRWEAIRYPDGDQGHTFFLLMIVMPANCLIGLPFSIYGGRRAWRSHQIDADEHSK